MICFILGILFVILQFKVNFSFFPGTIELIPSFVGYLFIYKGARKFRSKVNDFQDIEHLSLVLSGYSLLRFVMDIFALDYGLSIRYLHLIDSIVVQQLLPLFITYKIIWGISRICDKNEIDAEQDTIKMLFLYNILVSGLTIILNDSSYRILPMIASLIIYLSIMFYIYKAHNKYLLHYNPNELENIKA